MLNHIQKLIYYLSALAPLLIIIAVVLLYEKIVIWLGIIFIIVGIVLILYIKILIQQCKKQIAVIQITAEDICPNDVWVLNYIVAYLLPFSSFILPDINLIIFIIIAIVIILTVLIIKQTVPNPIFYIYRYHFYSVKADTGISYMIASKRNLRNIKQLKTVVRVFEYLLIDME